MTDSQVMNYLGFDEPEDLIQLKQEVLKKKLYEYLDKLHKTSHLIRLDINKANEYPDVLNNIILLTQDFLEVALNKNIYNDGFKCDDLQTSPEQKMTDEQIMNYFGLKTRDELGQLKYAARLIYVQRNKDTVWSAMSHVTDLAAKRCKKNETINDLHNAFNSLNKLIAFAENSVDPSLDEYDRVADVHRMYETSKLIDSVNDHFY